MKQLEEVARAWDVSHRDQRYVLVGADMVRASKRKAAAAARRLACLHLGMKAAPPVFFFRPETSAEAAYRVHTGAPAFPTFRGVDMGGHAEPRSKTIGVRVDDVGPVLVAEITAHEVFHLWQDDPVWGSSEGGEAEAKEYGEWATEVLGLANDAVAGSVHALRDSPVKTNSLRGVAEGGDVVVALMEDDSREVFQNWGSGERVEWVQHYRPCPVATR